MPTVAPNVRRNPGSTSARGSATRSSAADAARTLAGRSHVVDGGAGSDELELVISIPEDHPVDLAGHNYWLLVSGTPGSFSFQGQTIPLGIDPTLNLGVLMAANGTLPGFIGQLDAGNDAAVVADGSWFGDFTPGTSGAIAQSDDFCKSWKLLPLPQEPNSTMWTFATNSDDPKVIFAASRYGYLYRSDDGGASWSKLRRELSEIAAVCWLPN